MARPLIWAICGITLVAIAILFLGFDDTESYTGRSIFSEDMNLVEENGIVKDIIDGDTLVVTFSDETDRKIRVLGVDFPDLDSVKIKKWNDMGLKDSKIRECYNKGIKELQGFLLGEKVSIKLDSKETPMDKYGRILGYVYYGNLSISEYLVKNGYAVVYDPTEPICTECHALKSLEGKQGCLWE